MSASHVAILDLFGSSAALADAIGIPATSVRKWRQRKRIPSHHWPDVIAAAKATGKRVTLEMLVTAQPPRKAAA